MSKWTDQQKALHIMSILGKDGQGNSRGYQVLKNELEIVVQTGYEVLDELRKPKIVNTGLQEAIQWNTKEVDEIKVTFVE